ncbi:MULTISPECIES: hypothetical protein [unclassified Streptomyces]|uniref:hypothetical protein n=1 Tax=unclassified Streptomyces TaxID=2593676 RepID=UPI002E2E06CA|nr:hypothetical protein [Streptomyces sp. NBC_00223]
MAQPVFQAPTASDHRFELNVTVYAHVRLRLQRDVIDTLNDVLGQADDGPDDPPVVAVIR